MTAVTFSTQLTLLQMDDITVEVDTVESRPPRPTACTLNCEMQNAIHRLCTVIRSHK